MAYGSILFNYCMFDGWQMPDILNWFGWCTWDAFYTDVNSDGVKQGLERYFSTWLHMPQFCLNLFLANNH